MVAGLTVASDTWSNPPPSMLCYHQASQPILSSLIRQAHCSYAGCL